MFLPKILVHHLDWIFVSKWVSANFTYIYKLYTTNIVIIFSYRQSKKASPFFFR